MLARVLDEAAERFGDRTAYVSTDGAEVSYRDLREQSLCAALWLREQGVGEGDVVALILPATVAVPGPVSRRGAHRCGDRGDQHPTDRGRTRAAVGHRRPRDHHRCLDADDSLVRRPSGAATDRRRSGSSGCDRLHLRHHRPSQGRGVREPSARGHHRDRHRRNLGHRRRRPGRQLVRVARADDEAARQPDAGRHDLSRRPMARSRRARADQPSAAHVGRRHPHPDRVDASRSRLRRPSI